MVSRLLSCSNCGLNIKLEASPSYRRLLLSEDPMPESRAAAATAAKKAAKAAAKPYTTAARSEQAQALAERRDLARACAQAAYENGVGAKAAVKADQFAGKGLTHNMVHPLILELKRPAARRNGGSTRPVTITSRFSPTPSGSHWPIGSWRVLTASSPRTGRRSRPR